MLIIGNILRFTPFFSKPSNFYFFSFAAIFTSSFPSSFFCRIEMQYAVVKGVQRMVLDCLEHCQKHLSVFGSKRIDCWLTASLDGYHTIPSSGWLDGLKSDSLILRQGAISVSNGRAGRDELVFGIFFHVNRGSQDSAPNANHSPRPREPRDGPRKGWCWLASMLNVPPEILRGRR